MTDYRQITSLLVQEHPYRQIEVMANCSHRAIAKARQVLDREGLTTLGQVENLSLEDLIRFFTAGRKSVPGEFVPIDIDGIIAARLGRKKPPLKVLWAKYLGLDAPAEMRFYWYDRLCEIVNEHVRVHNLTAPIQHVPVTGPQPRVTIYPDR